VISPGDIVIVDKNAFEYAGISYACDTVGVVISILSGRRELNLDTDEMFCEVMMPSGMLSIFYNRDLDVA